MSHQRRFCAAHSSTLSLDRLYRACPSCLPPAVPQLSRPTCQQYLQSLLMRSDGGRRWIRLLHRDVHPSLVPGRAMLLHTLTVGPRRARLNHLITRWPPVTRPTIPRCPLLQLRLLGSPFGSFVLRTVLWLPAGRNLFRFRRLPDNLCQALFTQLRKWIRRLPHLHPGATRSFVCRRDCNSQVHFLLSCFLYFSPLRGFSFLLDDFITACPAAPHEYSMA